MPVNLAGWVEQQALIRPDSTAILAPGRFPLTFSRLKQELQTALGFFRQVGMRPGIPAALALPNGPENLTAFLAASAAGAVLLLNPHSPEPEVERQLSETGVRLVVVPAGAETAAARAARSLGAGIIEVRIPDGAPAGALELSSANPPPDLQPVLDPQVSILVLTSGTTSQAKAVQISQHNVTSMAESLVKFLGLGPQDRALALMPMFHAQGLLTTVFPALMSGGSLVCTPGLEPNAFFGWLEEFQPTWLNVSPTMLHGITSLAENRNLRQVRSTLRFIRTSSSPLPLPLHQQAERLFGVPVCPSYGMTEAAGVICCNPQPPALRKVETVGIVVSGEAAVFDLNGAGMLPPNVVGQVGLRGPAVTSGYLNLPDVNAVLFQDGWLMTGDLGFFDQDGYLTITGRLKELILRAGENISPYEVEDVLYQHPAVSQAAVFGFPDPALGEAVAAAVVLKQEGVTGRELRQFVAARLALSKVPEEFIFLPELPRGGTGKLQRSLLADKLSLEKNQAAISSLDNAAPQGEVEQYLAGLWCELLGIDQVSTNRRFLDLGGDSLLAARLAARLRQQLGLEIELVDILQAETIAAQAALLKDLL